MSEPERGAADSAAQEQPIAAPAPDLTRHAIYYKRQRDHLELQLIAAQQENERLRSLLPAKEEPDAA
jgi:hypothetical protein